MVGFFIDKCDIIREAIRRRVLEKQVGSIPNTGDSVKEIRELRKRLSKEKDYEKDEEIG